VSFLAEIFAHKRAELTRLKRAEPLASLRAAAAAAPPPLDFVAALRRAPGQPALIAEVKRRSPSRGELAAGFDPLRLARLYQQNGAAAISVLTDERYFGGSLEHLRQIAGFTPRLPLLRKDFICDPYQIYQARAAGADAILLIAAALSPGRLAALHSLAGALGLAALVEVHSRPELAAALACRPALVGINNRDLRDFSVSLETCLRLRPLLPPGVTVVAESGIHGPEHLERLAQVGVDAILVGEALVSAPDTAAKVRQLVEWRPRI
jgi:indole-3-glycerol phosphate synthase